MASLRIHVYKPGQSEPRTRIRVPLGVARTALRIMPAAAAALLGEHGVALAELAAQLERQDVRGTLAEIEKTDERIVIFID